MDVKLLELHFAQLAKSWSKSKFNNYSDKKKQAYKNELASLFNRLQVEDFTSLNETQILERSYIINFFFKSLEFLDSSTLNLIPFEIVECLRLALAEWLDESEKYIIVTSLINNPMGFSFDPSLAINELQYKSIKEVYQVEFKRRLIQINLPRFLVKDYLANVVLYHELGHFIDLKYNISRAIVNTIINRYISPNSLTTEQRTCIREYFPDIDAVIARQASPQMLQMHVGEYFCDIFASQYIEYCSNYYFSYITKGSNNRSFTHPSPSLRIQLVNFFLKGGEQNFVLDLIREATRAITQREITIRFRIIPENSFLDLLPSIIEETNQIHYLFVKGWQTWLGDWNVISANNNMQFQIQPNQVYNIINNLIEKSINNYIVVNQWEQANVDTEGTAPAIN